MYKGKYSKNNKRRLSSWAALAMALVLALSAGGTIAYLSINTDSITNTFTPTPVNCSVEETFQNNVKSGVFIKNTGEADAYIRAAVVVTWQDDSGHVYGQTPVAGTDYLISYANDTRWDLTTIDGYYYYTSPVSDGEKTDILIVECKPLKDAPAEGYTLSVEVLAQAIQSEGLDSNTGKKPVELAWGIDPAKLG